ncbi:hypothetical protein CsSME_00022469 [Camellia sinensis var. sinensis]
MPLILGGLKNEPYLTAHIREQPKNSPNSIRPLYIPSFPNLLLQTSSPEPPKQSALSLSLSLSLSL